MGLATLTVIKCTSTNAGTETDVSDNHVAFLNTDVHSLDTSTYPIAIPSAKDQSPNYSMETWLRFKLVAEPDSYVQNLKIYGASVQPDDPTDLVAVLVGATETGATPSDTGAVEYGAMTGSGLNDFECAGDFTGSSVDDYYVKISSAGTPDQIQYKKGSAGSWQAAVDITGDWQTLAEGVVVKFAATTGHTADDYWRIDVNTVEAPKHQHDNYYNSGANSLALTVEPADNKLEASGEKSWYVVFQLQVLYGAGQQLGTLSFNLAYEEA